MSRFKTIAAAGQFDFFSMLAPVLPPVPAPALVDLLESTASHHFYLAGDRPLARGWKARAQDNVAAIRLAAEIVAAGRPATPDEQARLARFVGFGATDLAQSCFPRLLRGFRQGWEEVGRALAEAVSPAEHKALARATQFAHYTPEAVIRAAWAGVARLGFGGGLALEPGVGTALFPALMPESLRGATRFVGIEQDPVSARIAALLRPGDDMRCDDFTRCALDPVYDLAIGNPPFSDFVVRTGPLKPLKLRLHDFFLVKALEALKPGGLAAFVTSYGTMDKADRGARHAIHRACEMVGAVRMPAGVFRATAGTDTGADLLFFRRRDPAADMDLPSWLETGSAGFPDLPGIHANRYFLENPDQVLGIPGPVQAPQGPHMVYGCAAPDGFDLTAALARALDALPEAGRGPYTAGAALPEPEPAPAVAAALDDLSHLHEGSYLIADGCLAQIVGGQPRGIEVRSAAAPDGIYRTHAVMIRQLIPLRDAVRDVLRLQVAGEDSAAAQARLRDLYDGFVQRNGPINKTRVTEQDDGSGGITEIHRQVNLIPFRDDPDCWLLASIEHYDVGTDSAVRGPIFTETVIGREAAPVIETASDALARCLHELGRVDLDRIAALAGKPAVEVLAELGPALYRNPETGDWETADAYLSGPVRLKLAAAVEAARGDHGYRRNVDALRDVQPVDIPPSDITARLGAPWIPVDTIEDFCREVLERKVKIRHTPEIATWSLDASEFRYAFAANARFGTPRYGAGAALLDALNARIPRIMDTERHPSGTKEVLNVAETEAAKEKLALIKRAFEEWVWTGGMHHGFRADRLARIYNDTYNDTVPRVFDGSHLILPGSAEDFEFRSHQKRVVWRIVSDGQTYAAHAVGSGKTAEYAGAVMEQRRLGLVSKPMLTVPGHCLAQVAREFLQVYPLARLLVADEYNFAKDRRRKFLARATTADWDCIIITHSAFKLIDVPTAFEQMMVADQVAEYEAILERVDEGDRLTRKRLERAKMAFEQKLEGLAARHDQFLTLEEIGVDQIIVDEAHEFRKLSFTSNMSIKGIDSVGSQMAWDLFLKAAFVRDRRASAGRGLIDRALIMGSGTPITNTLGEMFTLLRFMDLAGLRARNLHEFDAWAAAFGETRTDLELQPSGFYKPVTRFSEFVNVPELIAMFRARADVVTEEQLRDMVKRPSIHGGKRQLITSAPSENFRAYQRELADRIAEIEARSRPPEPGDDILLKVIGDGRHAAIDLRLVDPDNENEPGNKLNKCIARAFEIYRETSDWVYTDDDGTPSERRGATQMIFSDLGTTKALLRRGFSAYIWIKSELIRLGVPADEIAFVQDYKNSRAKARLFAMMRSGIVRFVIGSTQKMGTGVNAQNRLVALHHLDVPWLPSSILQREGRIDRQGNQNGRIWLYAYATEGSTDATMWQANERKQRFIAAIMTGDRSIRRIEDVGEDAVNQFAMAKALASGDQRLMQRAGLEADVARMLRLRAAHFDAQHAYRQRIAAAQEAVESGLRRIAAFQQAEDALAERRAAGPFAVEVGGKSYTERSAGGAHVCAAMKRVDQRLEPAAFRRKRDLVENEPVATAYGFRVLYTTGLDSGGAWQSCRVEFGRDVWTSVKCRAVTPGAVAFDMLAEAVDSLDGCADRERFDVERARETIEATRPLLGAAFELEGELAVKRRALDELDAELTKASDVLAEAA